MSAKGRLVPKILKNHPLGQGRKWLSEKAWNDAFELYKLKMSQEFVIRTTKYISPKNLNQKIPWHYRLYKCKYGGEHVPGSSGIRSTSTFRQKCPALISVTANHDHTYLEVSSINEEHNHKFEEYFEYLPERRKVVGEEKKKVLEMLAMNADKRKIREKVLSETGKKITRKDLDNIGKELRHNDDGSLEAAVNLLKTKYGATVHVGCDDQNQFKGLYFSTPTMRKHMAAHPEIIFFDGTYCLLENNFTLMIWAVEDQYAKTRIVSGAFVVDETIPTIKWLWECFKNTNSGACQNISCIMTDKDLTARPVIKEVIPHASLLICSFHVAKIFGREITYEKRGVNKKDRERILWILNKMIKSSSSIEYSKYYTELKTVASLSVMEYFDENWHNIQEQWVQYAMFESYNLGNNTNNRLESLNGRIKKFMKRRDKLVPAIKNFFNFIESEESNMKHEKIQNIIKKKVEIFSEDSDDKKKYRQNLARQVFESVNREIEMKQFVTMRIIDEINMTGEFQSRLEKLTVSPTQCQCSTWIGSHIPCRHIFHLRKYFNLSLFDTKLMGRWALPANEIQNSTEVISVPTQTATITTIKTPKKLSSHQRKAQLKPKFDSMMYETINCPQHIYDRRIKIINELEEAWKQDEEILLTKVNIKSTTDETELVADMSKLSIYDDEGDVNIIESPSKLDNENNKISQINIPVPIKNIGKRRETTSTLKIPKRKKKKVQFKDKPLDEQLNQILLSCLINPQKISMVLSGESAILPEDIPKTPADLLDPMIHGDINIHILSEYMSEDIMQDLVILIDEKKNMPKICNSCKKEIVENQNKAIEGFICCSSCLFFFHRKCEDIKKVPKTKIAFCKACK